LNSPTLTLHAFCDPALAGSLRQVFGATTGTFGVRALAGERWPAAREIAVVEVTGRPIRVKVGSHRVKPELDDVAGAAERTGLALHEVSSRAEEAWRRIAGPEPGTEP